MIATIITLVVLVLILIGGLIESVKDKQKWEKEAQYKEEQRFKWQQRCQEAQEEQDKTFDDMIVWRSKYLAEIEKPDTDYVMD